jgi:hypothetical protein
MSGLGSIGVVGLGIVPRRVAELCPGPRDFFEAWTEARDAGSGGRYFST